MIQVLFLLRYLGNGGTERQLVDLVRTMDKDRFGVTVATFYPGGMLWENIASTLGVHLVSLGKISRWDLAGFLCSGLRLVRSIRPHVIYSFGQEPNLVALLLGRTVNAKVVWGIRRSTKALPEDRLAFASFCFGAHLSHLVERVVYNSYCGHELHIRRGYCARNAVVIPNGCDTERFQPSTVKRQHQRETWGIRDFERLIGIVGRLHPVKDHSLFLRAASRVYVTDPTARFVCIGAGEEYRKDLEALTVQLGLGSRVHWAGECADMPPVYNALDLLALCSKEEGCPNVVAEAMACGIRCVVTDVGDAARLVGDFGIVVPPGNPECMANAWRGILNAPCEERRRLALASRERIVQNFGIETNVSATTIMIEGVLQ
jgi:glycosyltransferase involved in cell wall biosynthesis